MPGVRLLKDAAHRHQSTTFIIEAFSTVSVNLWHALTLSQRVLSQDDPQPVNRQLEEQTQPRTVQHSCMRYSSYDCCRNSLKAQSHWQTRMVNVLMAAVRKHCHAAFFKGGSMETQLLLQTELKF